MTGPQKGRLTARFLPAAMRIGAFRRALGVHVVYRSAGGGLIAGGLAYATLFALIPTLVLVVVGIFLLVDDPQFRQDAVDLLADAFPAFADMADGAVQSARELATVGGLAALIGFFWGASGLYLNLTRAMERFFPGERISGMLARSAGVLLVFLIIAGVLAVVVIASVVTVVARALELDIEWMLAVANAVGAFTIASLIVYAVYRVVPANPPSAQSARLPAAIVGGAVALMTLFYSVLSPWLAMGFQAFGVMASVFVALLWLRVIFVAMVYGAAAARYRDYVAAATALGRVAPDASATGFALEQEKEQTRRELASARVIGRRQSAATRRGDVPSADSAEGRPGSEAS